MGLGSAPSRPLAPATTSRSRSLGCIFGIRWTIAQIRPWILDAVELFGPDRCMFASHLPICKLACSVQQLYAAYLEVISDFSVSEKRQMLHDTAAEIYGL